MEGGKNEESKKINDTLEGSPLGKVENFKADGSGETQDAGTATNEAQSESLAKTIDLKERKTAEAKVQADTGAEKLGTKEAKDHSLEDQDGTAPATAAGDAEMDKPGMVFTEVLVMPESFKVAEYFDSLLTLKQVRLILCKRLSIPFTRFTLATRSGKPMADSSYITEYVVGEGPVQVVGTVGPSLGENYKLPAAIEVMVDTDINGHPVVVPVEIAREDLEKKKRYFGGFRDRRSGREYHHACTQTIPRPRESKVVKQHRETQTVDVSSKSVQSKREQGTQMARKDLYIDTENDKVITSQPYFSTEELMELKRNKALAIQCFIRQCFAWRKVSQLHNAKLARIASKKAQEELEEKLAREAEEEKIRKRMNPKTKADFDALYAELQAWKIHQEEKIRTDEEMSTEEQTAALQELLHKEIKLLQTIDKLKIRARSENKEERIKARLELMASPKEWLTSQGDYVEVITPTTTRASELVQLFNGLKLRNIPVEQRLDVILNVKFTVREFDCQLTRAIVELVNREQDMLTRGRSGGSLSGLRKRLENMFLQFIETPEFNPSSSNFQRAPYTTNKLTKLMPKSSTALYLRKVP
mmetsp:Transcript_6490/g.8973  ORF Transcript_6490/g.8973 Transcript_6490/m.8973 type:complete len:587 (+) Transcript_6490:177-1937(+)|eukprot:CAMPEP_0184489766 /NCGR_PEP_ID=MMETSP0113_2-20130426/16317_1 /TAXON_ID=91329 /ORGANISM="Norrisiella sphaerica, Strain BC52" /LENGTH=586 /DNA_ID=CAMNT_0026873367 /DNA_START=102 /DNA_END=1862 /DNA_ORIENTATION=-